MGKGGGKGHTPVEAKDNLKSTQMMSVIDAIGEEPVDGPEIIIIKLYRIV
ncbi:TPA: hypothetical protein RM991_004867 [Escherichia coli]|nr:hypothetical protein [Escherichia coli]HDW8581659.1 hypothetical protein [Escherichia coli]HDW8586433.1 hypothetical protein [Escherichia coli]HDW8591217.1 hypothetical protein [Escherichia coli]